LLLTRATSREREIALRVALGATRARLVRALLAESFLLAILGAAAGVLLTLWLMPVLRDITLPTVGVVHLAMRADLKLLSSALGLVLITGLVCGLLPALKATRGDLVAPLHLGGQGSTPPLRLRHVLVVVEVAASVVLLVTSLLFVRTLARLTTVTTGIDADHGVVATIELIPGRYTKDSLLTAVGRVLDRLDATPGIRSSSIADILPLAADSSSSRFEGEPALPESPRTLVNSVGPRYFETMGISLLYGRDFQASDRAGAPRAVIVSQAFAWSYFPDEEPLGKRVRSSKDDPFAEIVGVVQDANYEFVGEAPKPVVYYAYAQRSVSSQNRPLRIHARTSASPAALLHTVSDIVTELDKDAPVRVTTLRDAMGFEVGLRRATSLLLGWLGALGLFLATVGLYGVVSLVVASRTSEIGVRIALGASRNSVLWDILKRGLTLTVWGLVAGSAVALVAARVLVSLLVGVSPADPIAFTVSAIVFVLVGLLASYLPARRATRVNPLVALRDQ
jgi:putative ABC transport system permease protein